MTRSLARAWRRHLIAGLIVIAPVGVTAFVLWWIFHWLDGLLGRFLYPALGQRVPGLGLLALFLLLLFVGWIAERAIGSRILAWWHTLLERIPLARRIYSASSRIARTLFGEGERPFRLVALIEYPSAGRWSIGFITAPAPAVVSAYIDDPVTVFVPTTPNPTSGYLVILPRSQVTVLSMTVEEAFTYVLSAGSVTPEEQLAARPV
ncbi:MAG: DUF502 domain-containing protein [Gemmatimonadetes bacterium]|nr:DUF502 domain-containing protein [Gemmatimonadota bacterium]